MQSEFPQNKIFPGSGMDNSTLNDLDQQIQIYLKENFYNLEKCTQKKYPKKKREHFRQSKMNYFDFSGNTQNIYGRSDTAVSPFRSFFH